MNPQETARHTLGPATLFYGLLGLAAIGWAVWAQERHPWMLRPTDRWPLALSALVGGTEGLAVVGFSRYADRRFAWAQALTRQFVPILGRPTLGQAAWLAVTSGLSEELVFRGCLQSATGTVVAAIAFGALHMAPGRISYAWTLFALFIGLAFGFTAKAAGDLTAVFLAHVTINYFNLLAIGRSAS